MVFGGFAPEIAPSYDSGAMSHAPATPHKVPHTTREVRRASPKAPSTRREVQRTLSVKRVKPRGKPRGAKRGGAKRAKPCELCPFARLLRHALSVKSQEP